MLFSISSFPPSHSLSLFKSKKCFLLRYYICSLLLKNGFFSFASKRMSGTKLGAVGAAVDGMVSKRSIANVSDALLSRRSMAQFSAYASRASLRSQRSLASVIGPNGKPYGQLQLTPEEFKVIYTRQLNISDPQAPKLLVQFNFATKQFEPVKNESIISTCDQLPRIDSLAALEHRKAVLGINSADEEEEEEEAPQEVKEGEEAPPPKKRKEKVLRNQFNFSDRATQGYVLEYIDEGTLTEEPVPKDTCGTTNARVVYDYYMKDKDQPFMKPNNAQTVIRIMERVVNQNNDPNACCDFKYYDDVRDATDPSHAYTLPLWEFKADFIAGFQVTNIKWNPSVHDLFAASYSANATDKMPGRGYVCTWTLKNHSTPRNILELTDRATALDWCKTQPSILAVGAADGNLSIYDVRSRSTQPIFTTQKLIDRHQAPITVLRWQPIDSSGNLNIISAGLDGRIIQWTLVQSEMKLTEIANIDAGVVSLDYYNESSTHFKVACDDGNIYEVLRTRTTQPPTFFQAHCPPCVQLCHNQYHSQVFATCGTDWQIKLWRNGQTDAPLQIYDFAPNCINAIQFAPHSSTVFAAVSSDGILYIYDISINRFEPICVTDVLEINEGQLTSVEFHPKWPVILVGSERGRVFCLKLSPNLRKNTRTFKEEAERSKMSKSSSKSMGSRGLLPDLTQPPEEDEEGDKGPDGEEGGKREELIRDETDKFIKVMGVSWI